MTEQELKEIRKFLEEGGFDLGKADLTPMIEKMLDEIERLRNGLKEIHDITLPCEDRFDKTINRIARKTLESK